MIAIRMDLVLKDGTVADVKFSGSGCSISRAAASMLTEEVRGKNGVPGLATWHESRRCSQT